MNWPRSLRELRDVTSRFTRPKNVNYSPAPVDFGYGPHPFPGQGTRPAMVPTPPMTIYAPDGPQIPNATTVVNHPWPHNGAQFPANPGAGRTAAMATDYELQIGPAPGRIARELFERMRGINSPTGGNNVGVAAYPYNGDWQWLPHVPIVRQIYAVKNIKTFDDNAVVPAIYAGNPRQ